jgi:hypothetical protein
MNPERILMGFVKIKKKRAFAFNGRKGGTAFCCRERKRGG